MYCINVPLPITSTLAAPSCLPLLAQTSLTVTAVTAQMSWVICIAEHVSANHVLLCVWPYVTAVQAKLV